MPDRVPLAIGQLKAQLEFVVEEGRLWRLVMRLAIESLRNILMIIYDLAPLIFIHTEKRLICF